MTEQRPHPPTVDVELWRRAREIFDDLYALPAPERAPALDARCADDTALRQAVEALLKADEDLPQTRDDPLARGVGAAFGHLMPVVGRGQRFGPFAVVEEIGRGGMGVVYLAERDDGTVAQRVALKLVAHGNLDAEATARLAHERRLLAALEHPNIARLIDAGADATGIPYFAMEYVRGEPIVAYCDRHALPLAARLRLFREVCAAVQYAHANLIVHCDLKDGNILIAEGGLPKLLDFGIATTIDAARPDEPSVNRFLSPQTAAPEQFLGQASGVATDIYALGVLLCELAGGRRPFEAAPEDPDALRRRVLHDPPLLPSAAVTEEAARRRGGLGAASLRRRLRGDIDAIAARALGRTPQERYASVEQLDGDIARHLSLQPVAVRQDERGYRFARFLRRNALATAFAAVLGTLVLGFTAVTLRQNERLVQERQRAQRVTDFMVGLFQAAMPENARGREVTARELLQRGREQLTGSLDEQPATKASMLAAIAEASLSLDDLDGAERSAREAADLREASSSTPAERTASLLQLATIANRRGHYADALALADRVQALAAPNAPLHIAQLDARATALEGLARHKEALPVRREALAQQSALSGADDIGTIRAAMRLASSLRAVGELDEAEHVLSDALMRERRSLAPDDPALGETLLSLATLARNKNDPARAEPLATEALAIYRRIYGDKATQTATAMNLLGVIAQSRGDYARSRTLFEDSLAIRRTVYGEESAQVASGEYNVGLLLLVRLNQPQEAVAYLQRAVDIGAKVLKPGHSNLATYRLALGSNLRELGRLAEAETVLQAAYSALEAINAPRGLDIAIVRGELACIGLARGEASAREQLDAALAVTHRVEPDSPQVQRLSRCTGR